MLSALKMFRGRPAAELEPFSDCDPVSASLPESALDSAPSPTQRAAPAVKRMWFRNREPAPPTIPTPEDDARRLLRWVAGEGFAGEAVLPADMKKAYDLMCEGLERAPYACQLVGEPLRKLTGGRKEYTRIRIEPGGPKDKRRCIYRIPADPN